MVRDTGGYYLRLPHLTDDLLYPRWLYPGPDGFSYPARQGGAWVEAQAPTATDAVDGMREQDLRTLLMSHIVLEGLGERYSAGVRRQEAEIRAVIAQGSLSVLYHDERFSVIQITDAGGVRQP